MTTVKINFLSFRANSKQLKKYLRNVNIIFICVLGGCSYPGTTQPIIEANLKPPLKEKSPKTTFKKTITYTPEIKPYAPKISLDINTLLGKDKKFITVLLGKPRFLRHDPPSELWRYTTNSCILDFFAYLPKNPGAPKVYSVKYFEARTANGKTIPEASCLNIIYKNYDKQSKM